MSEITKMIKIVNECDLGCQFYKNEFAQIGEPCRLIGCKGKIREARWRRVESTIPKPTTNAFMLKALEPWIKAGSGDEWGEHMKDMMSLAHEMFWIYEDVSDFLWRKVLSEVILYVTEHLPLYGDEYEYTLAEQAADGFRKFLDETMGKNPTSVTNSAIMDVVSTLPPWFFDSTKLPKQK